MSRQFMPFYFGDYLRDTAHLTALQHGGYILLIAHCWQHGKLPESEKIRKNLTKFSDYQWKKFGPTLLKFFNEDGTHKRISREIEKAEVFAMKQRIKGTKGGFHSGIARAKVRIDALKSKPVVPQNRSNGIAYHKVSIEEGKQPSKKDGDLAASEALLRTCKTKGWSE